MMVSAKFLVTSAEIRAKNMKYEMIKSKKYL